jgi:hypothetical protein
MMMIMPLCGGLFHHGYMNKLIGILTVFVVGHALAQHRHFGVTGVQQHSDTSSYSGEQTREIKALSAEEQLAWIDGNGAGLAKAAELNSYPGPMHVLEHGRELRLSPSQLMVSQGLMVRHKAEVRELGVDLVEAERQLDHLFRTRSATAPAVSAMTERIANLQARIRASHLITHIEQTKTMSRDQIDAYDRLRGYAR